jgi:small multidrug resistance family-3 protein
MEQLALALALPLEMAGLFAIWNWSRKSRAFGWVVLGATLLMCLVGGIVAMPHNPLGNRLYAALFGMYLFSGLMWAWWFEGLKPDDWKVGEVSVALAAAGLFSFANWPI